MKTSKITIKSCKFIEIHVKSLKIHIKRVVGLKKNIQRLKENIVGPNKRYLDLIKVLKGQ